MLIPDFLSRLYKGKNLKGIAVLDEGNKTGNEYVGSTLYSYVTLCNKCRGADFNVSGKNSEKVKFLSGGEMLRHSICPITVRMTVLKSDAR
jgi:hypothetical protein